MLKKITALLLLMCLPFTFIACDKKEDNPPEDTDKQVEEQNDSEIDKKNVKNEKGETVKIYFYKENSKEIVYIEEKIDKENEGGVAQVDDLLRKAPNSELVAPLSPSSFIKHADAMTSPDTAFLDYTKNFIDDQNKAGLDEELALKCVAYTYCDLFGVNNTVFTIEGKEYKSSRLKVTEKYPIKLETSNINKYQE